MDKSAQIREIFKLWQRGMCPGGQVCVRKDGEIIIDECFGYADIERKIKITPNTIFHVASVSKQITCMSIFILREQGLVDIDHDIRNYIPDLVAFSEPVTVRNMMNNISGIRDQWVLQCLSGVRMGDIITQEDLIYLNKLQKELNFPPCSQYLYSNTNFVYLSEIVYRVSGKTLNVFAKENIFEPLQMNSTFIREYYDDLVNNRALSYIDMGDGTYKWKPLNFSNNGATSLHTTAEDFMKWLGNFVNPVICTAETLEEMCKVPGLITDKITTYASGLMTDNRSGHKSIGHGGADAGYRSHVLHFPEDKLDIVILSNVENIPMSAAAFKIADIIFDTDSNVTNEKYSEDVVEPVYGSYCLTSMPMGVEIGENGKGSFITYNNKKVPLVHEEGNKYSCSYFYDNVYFTQDGAYLETVNQTEKLVPLEKAVFTADEIENLAGLYYSDETESFFKIFEKDGKAMLSLKRYGAAEIKKAGEGIYFCPLEEDVLFKLVKDGSNVTGITFMNARVLNITFNKVKIC